MSTTWKQVVYDVADAWREANDSTAKIPVGELPNKVKEGGENIDPELTTLEGTLQEILEILPFKGAMASGQYVWEKYKLLEKISLSQTNSNINPIILKYASTEADLTKYSAADFIGLKFYTSNGNYLEIVSETKVYFSELRRVYTCVYEPSNQTLWIEASWSTVYVFHDAQKKQLDGFAVSDDATAYPDGGEQDGCWYELVKNEEFFEFTNILGYTKCSVSKFTFSSRTAVNNAVTHPFTGEIPYFVMIASSKPTTSNSDLYLAVGVKNVEANSGTINMGSQFYCHSSSDQQVNRDTAAFGVNRNATGNVFIDRNNLYYAAGVEYYLIVAL